MLVDKDDLLIIKEILCRYVPEIEVWAFGSRVHGEHLLKFSDLDLVLVQQKAVSLHTIHLLKEAFSDSNLPIRIDISDWSTLEPYFQDIIKKNYEVLQHKGRTT